ncbi:MAG: hypothetical protein RIC55_04425 [Pirellulaceae bacterium]
MTRSFYLAALTLMLCAASTWAQTKVETLVEGLNNPCGVAVQPETGDVFVADSGAHRIVRVTDGKAEEVIVGFPNDVYGKGPMYDIGPLGLAFLGKDTLVVGGGGKPDGEEMLRVYEVPAAGSEPIKADKMVASFTLPGKDVGTDKEIKGEGNFYALVVIGDAIYVSSNGDDTKGWVNKATIKDGKVVSYERSVATKEATGVDAPVGVTSQPRSGALVVGQMGEITVPNDALVTFYNPKNGKMRMNLETGLFDITGLAYSPKGRLYATDFAWMDTAEGGLFRLIPQRDGDKQGITTEKVTSLDKPTALTFGPDGALYITVIGTASEENANAGKLLKIAPGL